MPFIGVLLVLLIVFMVQTPMLCKCVRIEVPRSKHAIAMPDELKEDAVIVGVARDGKVYLDTEQVAPDRLATLIRSKIGDRQMQAVYIEADRRARYGKVRQVLSDVARSGVQLSLMTEPWPQGKGPINGYWQ